jgi:hypothetical protein
MAPNRPTPTPTESHAEQGQVTLTPAQVQQALARREKVRQLIGVMEKGFSPPSREEFREQLARQALSHNE